MDAWIYVLTGVFAGFGLALVIGGIIYVVKGE